MNNSIRTYFLTVLLCTLFGACSRSGGTEEPGGGPHDDNPNDITAPDVMVYAPTSNQVFTSGSSINVNGRVTDDYGLYRGSIKIINDATGFELRNQPYEIHFIRSYDFSISQQVNALTPTDYTVVVSFEDHGLNVTTKTVKVKVNP